MFKLILSGIAMLGLIYMGILLMYAIYKLTGFIIQDIKKNK